VAKVTSKLQVTLPKALARQYRIAPGDEISWVAAGDSIRVVPVGVPQSAETPDSRLRLFDAATARQNERARHGRKPSPKSKGRGWKREELYRRGRTR
jgi:bifunctional DNA-binding transcriptional regulator/antitoxin component of YhaV-PrlF toxin-antitoxin module